MKLGYSIVLNSDETETGWRVMLKDVSADVFFSSNNRFTNAQNRDWHMLEFSFDGNNQLQVFRRAGK
jgi:hypothetical protein